MFFAPFVLVVLAPLCIGQPANEEPIEVLIRKLGSDSGRMREAATKALLTRPESAPGLRRALLSKDAEVARRAQNVLDHFDLKKLDDAVAEGRVDRLIEALTEIPEGRLDIASWDALSKFGQKIIVLNNKQSRFPPDLDLVWDNTPIAFEAVRIPATAPNTIIGGRYFFRSKKSGWDEAQVAKGYKLLLFAPVIVSSGPVRFHDQSLSAGLVLARGPIEVEAPLRSLIIVAGDVKLRGTVAHSLVIAGGNVSCSGSILLSRIISSKSVDFNRRLNTKESFTDNDPNPLGYIRWSDTPKDKAAPKAK